MFPTTSGWYLEGALASPWASGALLEPSLTLYSVTLPDPAQCEPPPSSPQGSARPTRSTQHPMYGTSYALPPKAVFHCHFQAYPLSCFFSVFRHFPHPHIFIFEWHLHFFCKKNFFFVFFVFCFVWSYIRYGHIANYFFDVLLPVPKEVVIYIFFMPTRQQVKYTGSAIHFWIPP